MSKKGEDMKKLMVILTVVLISFALLSADVYIKQETKTGAFMGQPAKEIVQETWLGNNKMAMISQEGTFVLDLVKNELYMVNHKTKSYVVATLPLDVTKLMPEQMAQMMKGMMEGMTITVNPNGQTKKVMTWNTTGYDVNMKVMGMDMKMVFWASKDVPFDWKKYASLYTMLYKAQFRMGEKFMEEFKKVEGYPVATEMSVMGMEVKSTVTEISNKTPGPDIYAVPAGYTKKDRLSMEDMPRR
jgi:hypothetical protein